MPQTILSLDQGTTSSRAILFDNQGTVLAIAQQEFKQYFPHPGWVEHDALEIWRTQLAVVHSLLQQEQVNISEIVAMGITNQRETTVVWDRRTGEPIHPAIVWQCRRTAEQCDALKQAQHQHRILNKTGLVLDPYFSATKIAWILDHVPGARTRAEIGELAFGTIDSWLLWNLTQGQCHFTDVSNASRTLLFNLHTLTWDPELLELFNVPAAMLPEVHSSSELYAHCELFEKSIPITSMIGDQQAATFAQACFKPGQVKNTYGTGSFLVMNTGDSPSINDKGLLASVGWKRSELPATYILEGSVFIAGALIQWLRDELGIITQAADIETLAQQVEHSDGVSLVPAFAGLGAPYWNSEARGLICGLTRGTQRAHLARAALEAIALQCNDVLQTMHQVSQRPLQQLRVDGGASQNNLLMQIQADLSNIPVQRSSASEATALGAAYLAGLAVGIWCDEAEIAAHWQAGPRFEPEMRTQDREILLADWRHAVKTALYWAAD